jgi:4-hydroxy-tetrahydrodipicolinate synthase
MPQLGPEHIRGSICALVTPFSGEGVDMRAFADIAEWQMAQGTHGLVPCGTTGEAPTLSLAEHDEVIRICVEVAGGKVPVIAGTGSNSTASAIERTRNAEKAGADAVLLVAPYYNKPTQEGLYQHFKAVAGSTGLPVILYNVPGRTVTDISVETVARLAEISNIVGIKDATGDIARVTHHRKLCGEDFIQLSGEDATALAFNGAGGVGCISVTANAAPALCAKLQEATLRGDKGEALALQDKLIDLHEAIFLEASPSPVKYALSVLGKCDEQVRLPLVPPTEPTRARVRAAMQTAGLIGG